MFLFTVTSVEIVSAAGAKKTRMKRGRAADAAPRPVDVGSREVVDVSADSDAESAKRKMQVKIVFQGSATPPSKLEIEKGKTNIKQFRGSVFGLRDAGEKITFRVGHVTIEIGQGGDLSTLFDLADKEAEVSGQSEVVANVYEAAPNGEGGIGAHGGVHVSAGGVAGGAVGGRGGGAGRGWCGGGGVVGGGGSSGGSNGSRAGGGGGGGRVGQRQPLLFGDGSMFANGNRSLVEGGLHLDTGLEANKGLLYEHFLDGKVSVHYFLRMARGGGAISWEWPNRGGAAHLAGLIEFAERVQARPSEDPFA